MIKYKNTFHKFITLSTGVLETKRCIVYANSESEAKAKVESAGYRLGYPSFSDESQTLNSYIDAKEREGDFIVIR